MNFAIQSNITFNMPKFSNAERTHTNSGKPLEVVKDTRPKMPSMLPQSRTGLSHSDVELVVTSVLRKLKIQTAA